MKKTAAFYRNRSAVAKRACQKVLCATVAEQRAQPLSRLWKADQIWRVHCTAALSTRPSTMLRFHKFPTCVRSSSTTALSGTVPVQAPAGMTDAIDCPQVVQSASSATRSPLGHRWHALRLSPLSAPCQLPCWLAVCHQPPFTSQLAAQDLVCVRACVCLHMYSISPVPGGDLGSAAPAIVAAFIRFGSGADSAWAFAGCFSRFDLASSTSRSAWLSCRT